MDGTQKQVIRKAYLSERSTFILYASVTVSFLAGSSAPTPLYPVYASLWGFSAVSVTAVFGIYALFVLSSLLVFGRISDHIGRRPVLIVTTILQALAMYVIGTATGLNELLLARAIQGLATGAAVANINSIKGAVANSVAPIGGTALGSLFSGLLVHYLPAPTHLVYAVLGAIFLVQFAGVMLTRDRINVIPGAITSMLPQFQVPSPIKPLIIPCAFTLIAVWGLAGFFASLGPALIKNMFDYDASLAGGIALFIFAGCGALAVIGFRKQAATPMLVWGNLCLLFGLMVVFFSFVSKGDALFVLGTMISGTGFGLGFQGGIRMMMPLALPHERAGVLSVIFVCCYLGMGLPAMVAGYAVAIGYSLSSTAVIFGLFIFIFGAISLWRVNRLATA